MASHAWVGHQSPGVLHGGGLVSGEDLVEPGDSVLVKADSRRAQRALQLLHRARAGDPRGDARAGRQPGEPDVGGRLAELAAQRLVLLQRRPVLLEILLGAALEAPAALVGLPQRPGEQAAVQRAPRDDPDAVVPGGGDHLELDVAGEQVVDRLLADQALEMAPGGRLVGRGDLPARVVGGADVEHLALGDQRLARLPDLLPRRLQVDVMELVEVDPVGLQPAQRGLAGADDVARRQEGVVGPVGHAAVHLGRQHGLVPPLPALGEPRADHLLGAALALGEPVDVGRVEEVDPLLEGAVHDRVRVLLGGLPAEVHGAEAQPRDRQAAAAQVRVLHEIHPGTLAVVPQTDSSHSAFDAATAVTRAEGGGMVAELDPGWDVGGGILNGGYLLATAARAAVLDSPHPHPVALAASYLRATGPGRASLAVTPRPAGRTLAHSSVVLAGADGPSLAVQVTTATLGDDAAQYSMPAPEVPPAEECLGPDSFTSIGGRPTLEVGLRTRVETRLDPATAGWVVGQPLGEPLMRGWVRLADGREPDPFALILFADVLPPTSWALGLFGWAPTVQLQVLVRALPAPGWCLVEARAREVAGGWLDEDYRIWDSTGRLVAQSRQLARAPRALSR